MDNACPDQKNDDYNCSDYIKPDSLSCRFEGECDFCKSRTTDGGYAYEISHLYGWLYCKKHSDRVKQNAIQYYNDNLQFPVHWIGNDDIKLYRKSKDAVVTGKVDCLARVCMYSENRNLLRILVNFEDGTQRGVSLENIFHHNPALYEQLQTTNLRPSHHFKLSDLCQKIQFLVEEAHEKSKAESNSFVF